MNFIDHLLVKKFFNTNKLSSTGALLGLGLLLSCVEAPTTSLTGTAVVNPPTKENENFSFVESKVAPIINTSYTVLLPHNVMYWNLGSLPQAQINSKVPDAPFSYKLLTHPLRGQLSSCFGVTSTNGISSPNDLSCLYTANSFVDGEFTDEFTYAVRNKFNLETKVTVKINSVALDSSLIPTDKLLPNPRIVSGTFKDTDGPTAFSIDVPTSLVVSDFKLHFSILNQVSHGVLENCVFPSSQNPTLTTVNCTYDPKAKAYGSAVDTFKIRMYADGGVFMGEIDVHLDVDSDNTQPTGTATTPVVPSIPFFLTDLSDTDILINRGIQSIYRSVTDYFTSYTDAQGDSIYYYLKDKKSHYEKGILGNCLGLDGSNLFDYDCTFNPNQGATGLQYFDVWISDEFDLDGTPTNKADDQFYVNLTNRLPSFSALSYMSTSSQTATASEDASFSTSTFSLTQATDFDMSTPYETLSYQAVSLPSNGVLKGCYTGGANQSIDPSIDCEYRPTANYDGSDTFKVRVTDLAGATAELDIDIDIIAVDDAPEVVDEVIKHIYEQSTDSQYNTFSFDLPTDIDSETLKFEWITTSTTSGQFLDCFDHGATSSGSFTGGSRIECSFAPAGERHGTIEFDFRVWDETSTESGKISFEVISTNSPPSFPNGMKTKIFNLGPTSTDSITTFKLELPHAYDPDSGDTLNYSLVPGFELDGTNYPTQGTLSAYSVAYPGPNSSTSTYSLMYTPQYSTFSGNDGFVIKVDDEDGSDNSVSYLNVVMNIFGYSLSPTVTAQTLITSERSTGAANEPISIVLSGSDAETTNKDELIFTLIAAPTRGELRNCLNIGASGPHDYTCDYFPDVGGCYSDQIRYSVSDGTNVKENTVTIEVEWSSGDPQITLSDSRFITGTSGKVIYLNHAGGIFGLEIDVNEGIVAGREGCEAQENQETLTATVSHSGGVISHSFVWVGYDEASDLSDALSGGNFHGMSSTTSGPNSHTGTLVENPTPPAGSDYPDAAARKLFIHIIPDPSMATAGVETFTIQLTDSGGNTATETFTVEVVDNWVNMGHWTDLVFLGALAEKDISSSGTGGVQYPLGSNTYFSLSWDPVSFNNASDTVTKYYVLDHTTADFSGFTSANLIADYLNPANVISASTENTYTSTAIPSSSGGQKRYYTLLVESTVSGQSSSPRLSWVRPTGNDDRIIDVVVPFDNQAFVHRWVANYKMCEHILGATPDKTSNYQCTGVGHGSTKNYDFERHLLVHRFEYGCNFDFDSDCSGGGADFCVGHTDVDVDNPPVDSGTIGYLRDKGTCLVYFNGSWRNVAASTTTASLTNKSDYAAEGDSSLRGLPPLVGMDRDHANTLCADFDAVSISGGGAVNARLPTSTEYMTMSMWDHALSNTEQENREAGSSSDPLSASAPQCNTSCQNTLSAACNGKFLTSPTSFDIDATLSEDVLASGNSGRAVLDTGSKYTGNPALDNTNGCKSVFGIQDLIGNVDEWVSDAHLCNRTDHYWEFTAASIVGGGSTNGMYRTRIENTSSNSCGFKFDVQNTSPTFLQNGDFPHESLHFITNFSDRESYIDLVTGLHFDIRHRTIPDPTVPSYFFSIENAAQVDGTFPVTGTLINNDKKIIDFSLIWPEQHPALPAGVTTTAGIGDEWSSSLFVNPKEIGLSRGGHSATTTDGNNEAGRFFYELKLPTSTSSQTGFRCVFPVDAHNYMP